MRRAKSELIVERRMRSISSFDAGILLHERVSAGDVGLRLI